MINYHIISACRTYHLIFDLILIKCMNYIFFFLISSWISFNVYWIKGKVQSQSLKLSHLITLYSTENNDKRHMINGSSGNEHQPTKRIRFSKLQPTSQKTKFYGKRNNFNADFIMEWSWGGMYLMFLFLVALKSKEVNFAFHLSTPLFRHNQQFNLLSLIAWLTNVCLIRGQRFFFL